MDEQLHNHEKLDAYFLGYMPADEREKFEEELASNPALKEELEIHKAMIEGIKEHSRDEFKKELKNIDNGIDDTPVRSLFPRKMAMVAAVGLLTALGAVLLTLSNSPEKEIFTQYFEPWESEYQLNTRGAIPEEFDDFTRLQFEKLQEGADHYDNQEYEEAIEVLKELEHTKRDNPHVRFLLGLSYLSNEQAEESKPYFESLLKETEFEFMDEVKWYYGMCLIVLGETDKAIEVLNQVSLSGSKFQWEARDVISDLKDLEDNN